MQESQTIGLDLPQKILVWQNAEGTVHLSYNDPEFLKLRQQIKGRDAEIQQIATALGNLTNSAAGGINLENMKATYRLAIFMVFLAFFAPPSFSIFLEPSF